MSNHETFRRRNLPHWDMPGATYFVTACLAGSIPARGLLDLDHYKNALEARPRPPGLSQQAWIEQKWKRLFARADRWLDSEPAVRHLADPVLAGVVMDAMLFFAGTRYDLLAFVVMPSHIHWVFCPRPEWVETFKDESDKRSPRERIMHSLKSFTARECNRHLGLQGSFWQEESYDHWARGVDELERIIHYVEYNPVKAGLTTDACQWSFGSTAYRERLGLAFGVPLPRITV